MSIPPEDIQEILRIFSDSHLQELRLEVGDLLLHVSKDSAAGAPGEASTTFPSRSHDDASTTSTGPSGSATHAASPTTPAATSVSALRDDATSSSTAAPHREGLVKVVSPSVGIFFRRPSAEQAPYVEVGDAVAVDTPVATLEVMKMYTEVQAGCAGTIVEICVANNDLVEYGQTLMYVRPSGTSS